MSLQEEYDEDVIKIEELFTPLVLKCKENGRAMRIGTNHGLSLVCTPSEESPSSDILNLIHHTSSPQGPFPPVLCPSGATLPGEWLSQPSSLLRFAARTTTTTSCSP